MHFSSIGNPYVKTIVGPHTLKVFNDNNNPNDKKKKCSTG